MVGNERSIDENGDPLPSKQEEKVDEDMETILRQHQGIQTVALVNGVLVVSLQLIKSYDLKKQKLLKIMSPWNTLIFSSNFLPLVTLITYRRPRI